MKILKFAVGLFFAVLFLNWVQPDPPPIEAATFDAYCVNRSSFTATLATTARIPDTDPGDILWSVIVGSSSVSGGQLAIYNSSGTSSNQVADLEIDSVRDVLFSLRVSSAITYSMSGGAGAVTILWCNEEEPD